MCPQIQKKNVAWTLSIFACWHLQKGFLSWSLGWGNFTMKCKDSVPGLAYLTTSTTWWDLIVSWSRGDFQHSFVGLTANSYMICYMVFNNPIKKKVYKIHLVYYLFSIVLSDLVLMQAVLASLTSGYWISYMIWQWSLQMKIVISVWRK